MRINVPRCCKIWPDRAVITHSAGMKLPQHTHEEPQINQEILVQANEAVAVKNNQARYLRVVAFLNNEVVNALGHSQRESYMRTRSLILMVKPTYFDNEITNSEG